MQPAKALQISEDARRWGLFAEFVAPRLWSITDRRWWIHLLRARPRYAIDRSKRAVDIANMLGTRDIVLWLAREGTYIREARTPPPRPAILDAVNALLDTTDIRILAR